MPRNENSDFWRQVQEQHHALSIVVYRFLQQPKDDYIKALKHALKGEDRIVALDVAQRLPPDDLKMLLPELVFLASWDNGFIGYARGLIASLPREWLLNEIEKEAEPYLKNGDEDDYRRFLELYTLLDRDLVVRLANRALNAAEIDLIDLGKEYLEERLQE